MLKQAENELLTQVGPGTAMGAVMRRYWISSRKTPLPLLRPVSEFNPCCQNSTDCTQFRQVAYVASPALYRPGMSDTRKGRVQQFMDRGDVPAIPAGRS